MKEKINPVIRVESYLHRLCDVKHTVVRDHCRAVVMANGNQKPLLTKRLLEPEMAPKLSRSGASL